MIFLQEIKIESDFIELKPSESDNNIFYQKQFEDHVKEKLEEINKNKYYRIYFRSQNIYKHKNNKSIYDKNFLFTAIIYPNSYLSNSDNKGKTFQDLIQHIKSELSKLQTEFNEIINANLSSWKITGLTISSEVKLNHDYCEYINIIEDLNPKYHNLKIDFNNGNTIYFLNESKKSKDISKQHSYIKFTNVTADKILSLKAKKDKGLQEYRENLKQQKQNILLVEMLIKKTKTDLKKNAELCKYFGKDLTEEATTRLTIEDLQQDYANGCYGIKQYFFNPLKNRFFVNVPEDVQGLDKEKLYNYLSTHKDNKVKQAKAYLYIIGCLFSDYNLQGLKLQPIKKKLKSKMSNPEDVDEKFKIITNIRDYIVRDNKISSAELYNELYSKLIEKEKEEHENKLMENLVNNLNNMGFESYAYLDDDGFEDEDDDE